VEATKFTEATELGFFVPQMPSSFLVNANEICPVYPIINDLFLCSLRFLLFNSFFFNSTSLLNNSFPRLHPFRPYSFTFHFTEIHDPSSSAGVVSQLSLPFRPYGTPKLGAAFRSFEIHHQFNTARGADSHMKQYLEVLLLGIVQGIAEFLPISSSGHLVILESLMGKHEENLVLNVALHFGTLLSILVVYRNELFKVFLNLKMLRAIFIASLPVVIVGLTFKEYFETTLNSPLVAGLGLLLTSALLFLTPRIDNGERQLPDIRLRDAFVIGLFQAIAPLPGVSRSGSTIVGGLLMGLKREDAANFSFYIAIPVLGGATLFMLKDIFESGGNGTPVPAIMVGIVVSFVVGLLALSWLLKLIVKQKLIWFAWYCLAMAILTITISSGLLPSVSAAP